MFVCKVILTICFIKNVNGYYILAQNMDELEELAHDIYKESRKRAGTADYDIGYNTAEDTNLGTSQKVGSIGQMAAASIPEIDLDDLADKVKDKLINDETIREAIINIKSKTKLGDVQDNHHESKLFHGNPLNEDTFNNDKKTRGDSYANLSPEDNARDEIKETKTNQKSDDIKSKKRLPADKFDYTDLAEKELPKIKNKEITDSDESSAETKHTSKNNKKETQKRPKPNKNKNFESNQGESEDFLEDYNDKEETKMESNLKTPGKMLKDYNGPPKYLQKRKPINIQKSLQDAVEKIKQYKEKQKNKKLPKKESEEASEIAKPPSDHSFTQNINWDDYDENNSKPELIPTQRTKLTRKPKYLSSTPDFFKSAATAEPYNFEEPLPENDRVPETAAKLKPLMPVKVNGKKIYKIKL